MSGVFSATNVEDVSGIFSVLLCDPFEHSMLHDDPFVSGIEKEVIGIGDIKFPGILLCIPLLSRAVTKEFHPQ